MRKSVILTVKETAELLLQQDDILILCHKNPDGDTVGSAFGLFHALKSLNKRVRVECNYAIPLKYSYMFPKSFDEFSPKYIVAVDVADSKLLGDKFAEVGECVNLCIDHHSSNREYAENLLLEADSASACELVYKVVREMNVEITPLIADCFYTGIATDTGCFKYSNTSSSTHRAAADLIDLGCNYAKINQIMFETIRPNRIALEQQALATLEYHYQNRCAILTITRDMLETTQASDDDMEGLPAIPRQIEGVWVGVTLKQLKDRSGYKISLRSTEEIDASAACQLLEGGGHARAAGCTVLGDAENAKNQILQALSFQFQED